MRCIIKKKKKQFKEGITEAILLPSVIVPEIIHTIINFFGHPLCVDIFSTSNKVFCYAYQSNILLSALNWLCLEKAGSDCQIHKKLFKCEIISRARLHYVPLI